MRNIVLIMVALLVTMISSFAQINWQKGGNGNIPLIAPSTIGTDATWNAPFRMMTFGQERMRINQNRNFNIPYFGSNPIHTAWYLNNS